jgi:hypothetical protein
MTDEQAEARIAELENEVRILKAAAKAQLEQMKRLTEQHSRVCNELAEYEGGQRSDQWLARGMRSASKGKVPWRFQG